MKTLFITLAVAVAFVFAVFGNGSNLAGSMFMPSANLLSQKVIVSPLPGIYQATPHSAIVVVPHAFDGIAVHVPKSTNRFAIRSIEPPLHLEPKK